MAIATTAGGVDFVQVWDKTLLKSGNVEHSKVTFKNRFGITLAADVYKPKVGSEKFAATCRREQSSSASRQRSSSGYNSRRYSVASRWSDNESA